MLLCDYVYNVFVCVLLYLHLYVYLCVFVLRMCYDHGVCVFMCLYVCMRGSEYGNTFFSAETTILYYCYLKLK